MLPLAVNLGDFTQVEVISVSFYLVEVVFFFSLRKSNFSPPN